MAKVTGGVWQPRPPWTEGRSLLSLTGKSREGAGHGCHRVTGRQRGQKAGPRGVSPGGRGFSMWAFGGNRAASARCAVGSEPSGKPDPVCFLSGEGWWPRPDSEMGQNFSAGTSHQPGWGTSRLTFHPCWTCPPPAGAAWGAPPPTALPALGGRLGTLAKAHFGAKFWVHLGAYGGWGRVHTVVLSRCAQEGLFLQGRWEWLAQTGSPPTSQGSPLCTL